MAMPTLRRLVACLVSAVLLTISCGGGSPAAPSSSGPANVGGTSSGNLANVAGTWSGALTFNGALAQGPITMQLTQAQGAAGVSGTWSGKNNWSGTIAGSVSSATFAGQLVWNYTSKEQGLSQCMATAAVSGNTGGASMTWTSLSITRDAKN